MFPDPAVNTTFPTTRRLVLTILGGCVVAYSVVVLWYVSTCPDVGFRLLLADDGGEIPIFTGINDGMTESSPRIGVIVHQSPNELSKQYPQQGDLLCSVNGKPTRTFLDFARRIAELRDSSIPPGGKLLEGADPTEEAEDTYPPLVQVGESQRQVAIGFVRSAEQGRESTYAPLGSLPIGEIALTFVWFLLQLAILGLGAIAFWNRPYGAAAPLFCAMCLSSLGAFVGGFHWWVVAGNPWLNVPFIVCAGLLPAITLHFFLAFPRERALLVRWPRMGRALIYGLPVSLTALMVGLYLTAWGLNGVSAPDERLETVAQLLIWLREGVFAAIALAAVYFFLTVTTLVLAFRTTRNPVEKSQVRAILLAALVAAVPVGYSLVLAFSDRVGLAFGKARIPMFIASLVFMLAYANGMIRHKLMLVDELVGRGKLYYAVTAGLMAAFAALITTGGAAVHVQRASLSPLQQFVGFAVLMLGVVLLLWLRDQIQQVIDRRFFSEKYQLDKALQRMNRAAGRLADPDTLATMMLGTCRDALQIERSAIYFRHQASGPFRLVAVQEYDEIAVTLDDEGLIESLSDGGVLRVPSASREAMSPVQSVMHALRAELLYPMVTEDGIVGLIVLGRKRGGTPFTAEDLTFLQATTQITTIALHSARANQHLAQLNDELQLKVDRIADQQRQLAILKAELDHSGGETVRAESARGELERTEIKGSSPAIRQVLATVTKVANTQSTVLIRGESGTGKELLAKLIHRNSARRDGPLVSVHCAALSESLLESELFGHARGAFTGAHRDRVGRFESAHGGTLFLDEIGDISAETQVKLLRVLQERCFEPVGSARTVHVDVRLITATNRNLEQLISEGLFREDLYYRLNVIRLNLPPLRERPEDLIELVFHFINRSAGRTGKQIRRIEPEALAALERYPWPGNIRELENAVERAVVLAEGASITLRDLPTELLHESHPPVVIESEASLRLTAPTIQPPAALPGPTPERVTAGSVSEREQLAAALSATAGNKAEAARRLGLPRSTFYSKLKKYDLA